MQKPPWALAISNEYPPFDDGSQPVHYEYEGREYYEVRQIYPSLENEDTQVVLLVINAFIMCLVEQQMISHKHYTCNLMYLPCFTVSSQNTKVLCTVHSDHPPPPIRLRFIGQGA